MIIIINTKNIIVNIWEKTPEKSWESFFYWKVEQELLQTEGLKILRQIDPIQSEPNSKPAQ